MNKGKIAGLIGLLLAGAAVATPAAAQTVAHPKPVSTRGSCTATPSYELVSAGSSTPYRLTSSTAPGGYDPTAPERSCGNVTRAQPLLCVDQTGAPTANQDLCDPKAKMAFESQFFVDVYRNTAGGLPYYTADSTALGSPPIITAIRLRPNHSENCIQLAELEAYEDGVNIALASKGAQASATNQYSGESSPSKAIDGVRPSGWPNIYHSRCTSSDQITVTLAKPARVSKLVAYGRTDYGPYRDIYFYDLLNGNTVVGTGVLDARAGSGQVSLNGSCDPENLQWRKTKASTAGICGTQTVQDTVECVDVNSAGTFVVAASRCNAAARPANDPYQVTSRDGCGYDFSAPAWAATDPACGSVTQTRTVSCVGSDGQPAAESACASYLTAPSATTPASEYWSKGAYAWPGAPGDSITVYRLPTQCTAASPADMQKICDARFVNKNGTSQAYLRPKDTRTFSDQRACTTTPPSTYAWNVPVYVPDRTNVCGANTRTGSVYCLKDGTTKVADSFCPADSKPATVQNFEDTSGCTPSNPNEFVNSVTEIQLGTCNYTSSGGGRHACGDRYTYRPGPAAPYLKDLCTGSIIAGVDSTDKLDGTYQTPRAGKGWTKTPVLQNVPGARCVVHWKIGYSDSDNAVWQSTYFNGPATGTPGGHFIGRKP